MNYPPAGLLAQIITTQKQEFVRLGMMTEWWHWVLLAGVCLLVPAVVIWMYIRDTRELPAAVAISLAGLRVLAMVGLLFTFLDFEERTESKSLQNSRVVMLIDASQSMGLEDADSTSAGEGNRRIDLVANELAGGAWLKELRKKHDVVVMRFDESEQPVELASYTKVSQNDAAITNPTADAISGLPETLQQARVLFAIAAGLMFIGVPLIMTYVFSSNQTGIFAPIALLAGVCLLAAGAIFAAVTNLTHLDASFAAVVGTENIDELRDTIRQRQKEDAPQREPLPEKEIDWTERLTPGGNETRLGEALMTVINRQRGAPIAGIVLITDGRSNAGLPYTDAVTLAQEAEIPIPVYCIGMGSNRRPTNAALVDLEAPTRVYPGDRFTITGFVQAFGLDDRPAKVELISYPYGQDEETREQRLEDDRNIRLSAGGVLQPVKFEIEPDDEAGKRVYVMRIIPPSGETNVRDNQREAVVEIIERRTRVLLLASGPSREYRFLRNQLYRDKETIVDVLLQSARPGVSQEADEILYEFPEDPDELFQYDAIIAFDPDWEAIPEAGIKLLEEWVSRQAGGLVVVAGPVHTPKWAGKRRGDVRIDLLKGLYPVQFFNWGTSQGLGRFGAEQTSRLEFTRAGLESEFLLLGESASESEHAWAGFDGVYGYYAVKDVKPGATIYARFSNEAEAVGDEAPVFMAGQYYGAGRVFFLGSGELWRIRSLDPAYFETFYTKLIRHVAGARLLRDSKRGVLVVERTRYKIGDAVNLQARLTDAQHRPLSPDDVAQVQAIVARPDGKQTSVLLRNVNIGGGSIAGREGVYAGQFTALQLGDYNIQLTVPGSGGEDVLNQRITVRAPHKEIEQPERNDALLIDLADSTGGEYYNSIMAAVGRGQVTPLAAQIQPRDRLNPQPDVPNIRFERHLMMWLLSLIAGALCLEWLIRRVSKLA